MIKPTLFVGLGTTGTNILKTLRLLMSEEYRDSGLPIFRYVSIETREAETGDNPRQFKDYEQISVVNATIEDTVPIRRKLDSNQPRSVYNPHLKDWLNPLLLDQIQSFKDGAGNIRMAGRLCLWENWEEIRRTLSSARNDIIDHANIQRTQEILTKHYEAKNLDVPNQLVDQDGINAYVVGTLCGGSCSGMFIDMAYFIGNLLGGNNANNVYGVFTMFDRISAGGNSKDTAIRAANCFTGLSELNYYNHPGTNYDVTFPSHQRVNTIQKPFDYAMLVSPTGKLSNVRFVSGGEVDEEGLNLMVALNLFAEGAGDTDGEKDGIRADWVQFGGYGELKEVPRGDTPTMVRCLASFGLTAVWYPKYRIATAAACLASQRLCQGWLNRHIDRAAIRADAANEWGKIRGNANVLISPETAGQPALEAHITGLLDRLETLMLRRQASADDLRNEMNMFPGEDARTFSTRFASGGMYFAWMESKVDDCKEAFSEAIDNSLKDQLTRIDFQGEYGLGNVYAFFEELDRIIGQAFQQCPEELPVLDLSDLDFDPMRRLEKNPWTRITGVQEEAVKAHRERLIRDYRQLIVGRKVGICQNMRNYFLREVLEAVRAKLGFQIHSDGPTIKRQLDQIRANLETCSQALHRNYESAIEPPQFKCVKIVTNDPQNNIQTDAESLSTQIASTSIQTALMLEDGNSLTMDVFLKKGHEDLRLQMTETCRRAALRGIDESDEGGAAGALVVTKAQSLLNTTGDDIRDLARRSNPYQEFAPEYQRFELERGTKIVFGHDPTLHRLNNLQNNLNFDRSGGSDVDHLLFFYEEEAGFTVDDLAVYELLQHYLEQGSGVYGHWTHSDPNFYDLKLHDKNLRLSQWCRALMDLVPGIIENNLATFDDVLAYQGEDLVFTYQDEVGLDKLIYLSDHEKGIKELCRHENEVAYNNFFDSIKAEFTKIEKDNVIKLVNGFTKKVKDRDERARKTEFYSQFVAEVYPDGVGATTTPINSGSVEAAPPFNNVRAPEQTEAPKGPGAGLTAEEFERIQQVLNTPPTHWTEEDRTLMREFSFEELPRIQQVLGKPMVDWTEEDWGLMQRFRQNLETPKSESRSTDRNRFVKQGPTKKRVHS